MTPGPRDDSRRHAARLRFPAVVFAAIVLAMQTGCAGDAGGWRPVLTFDVLDPAARKTADLDDGNVLVARRDPGFGWDIGVYPRPFQETSENLLYGGKNLHGAQPWFVFAWTKQDRVFPDVREIGYGSPERRLRIELSGCETRKDGDKAVFVRGAIRVSWKP
jgi:hypothetical protein